MSNVDKSEIDALLTRVGKLEDQLGLILQLLILNRPPLHKQTQYALVLDSLKEIAK